MVAVSKTARQSPLKVDPEANQLISQGAHFLGLTKKDLKNLGDGTVEALQGLDGSLHADVILLIGLTAEEIDAVGGIDE
ncbi:hypothetical protein [Streptomyces thermovulgaris]|uniref:hypothetical protein n=1 Tax=Streptomyces thermovulgaris TaxID=1934 RepID=UPI00082F754C|nr:hypothetical protein [Streptomyces thermovulgaris]